MLVKMAVVPQIHTGLQGPEGSVVELHLIVMDPLQPVRPAVRVIPLGVPMVEVQTVMVAVDLVAKRAT